jgi:DNA-binding XRE family transcriptional regulator
MKNSPTAKRRPTPAPDAPAKKGRKRSPAATGFARWLDQLRDKKGAPIPLETVAEDVGISASSLYQIRRGDQGVSLVTAAKLIAYSKNKLTLADFTS